MQLRLDWGKKMYKLPKKLRNFTPYEPLVGDYPVRLDVNESFIEVPHEKVAAAIEKVKLNRYPDPYATEAVSAFARLFGVESRYVTAGNGSDELIGLICAGLLEKGDKVLTLNPDFSMYGFYAKLYELEVITLPKRSDFTFDTDEIREFIRANGIKCVIFSNPCNPTSLGLEKDEVRRLISGSDALVVLDEAYMDFWDESQSLLSEVSQYSNLVVLRTCSKSVALAGIRMGFAVSNEEITYALRMMKSPFNVNSLTQAIAAEILFDGQGYANAIGLIKASVRSLKTELERMSIFEKIYDTKTNFVFIETPRAEEICEYLLKQGIAIRRFGTHLRICAGTHDENRALLKALEELEKGNREC
ncbi:MAG: histidinol-phosphate aminotransferase family protein [Oscillospiraceae bacterium]|nr:histidinol-phosphate aminotransferase family protein [Oscillospiraceae bacterium]